MDQHFMRHMHCPASFSSCSADLSLMLHVHSAHADCMALPRPGRAAVASLGAARRSRRAVVAA
eukprot:5760755-Pleurochrysis_carterae.AAC.3